MTPAKIWEEALPVGNGRLGAITEVAILSKAGNICRIDAGKNFRITYGGKRIASKTNKDGSIEFKTIRGGLYKLLRK